jgi:hypothetical protein
MSPLRTFPLLLLLLFEFEFERPTLFTHELKLLLPPPLFEAALQLLLELGAIIGGECTGVAVVA